uniref:Uncharacterized protein n=1 Tax=Arundo donax TaxID=35708 RepID=A0A0A9E6S9_ARUDO
MIHCVVYFASELEMHRKSTYYIQTNTNTNGATYNINFSEILITASPSTSKAIYHYDVEKLAFWLFSTRICSTRLADEMKLSCATQGFYITYEGRNPAGIFSDTVRSTYTAANVDSIWFQSRKGFTNIICMKSSS